MAIYDRVCRECGAEFKGGPRAWYCPDCRTERKRERGRYYKRYGYDRHIGDTDVCKNCGEEYIISGGKQMYCEKCQKEMHMKVDRQQSIAYYTEHKEAINHIRNERRRAPERKCVVCGKLFSVGNRGCAKTCSKECKDEYYRFLHRMIYNKRRPKKDKKS